MASPQTIVSKDIYHGLPTFPEDLVGLTAIVTGANGISGHYMLRVLCESPQRWKKIYALSRRPPNGTWPSQVEHVPMDFLQSPEILAAQFAARGITADYVFFFAYLQPAPQPDRLRAAEDLIQANTHLLQNFLDALALTNALPKTILLQLGAKYYGVHLGPTKLPQEESDPRITLEPNFYYPQEDSLSAFATQHNLTWVTTRPSWIPGAVPDAAMNAVLPLAIYATVQKHLRRPLDFPSDLVSWELPGSVSSAHMTAYLSEWAVLTPAAHNTSLNASDDCAFTWGNFWPKLAGWFGMEWTGPQETGTYVEQDTPFDPPPRGFGPPGKLRGRFTLVEWARTPEVQGAWREIAARHGLRHAELWDTERVFGFGDGRLMRDHPIYYSTTKVKKLGFFGFVDSDESVLKVIREFVDLKMIPPLP